MVYHYLASDKEGKIVESDIDADTLDGVLQLLAGKDLRPISVEPAKERGVRRHIFRGRITLSDKVFLVKYLSLMLKVGADLLSAVNILIADFEKPVFREFLLEIKENLGKGQPFYKAFEAHPKYFSTEFINLIKAAEFSGNLEAALDNLAASLLRESELRGRVRSALIYPLVIVCASLGIITFLVTFALPKIAKVFSESGITPPFFSRVVFSVGLFMGENIFAVLGGLAALVAGALLLRRTVFGAHLIDAVLRRTFLIKNIYRDLAVQRLSSTMSQLIRAGLPITDTIRTSAETVAVIEYKYALRRIADEGLAKGFTLGEAFRKESAFPRVFVNLVAISEKAGHLDEVLETLAEFYSSNVDGRLRALVSLLEPALLLAVGSIVALIALSIIVPVYQLTSQF